MRVLVTASNVDGTRGARERRERRAGLPVPAGQRRRAGHHRHAAAEPRLLSATRGTWTGPDNMYGFQWQRDFGEGYVDIAGATGAAYTLTVDDVDATVRVLVTATNPDATIVETSEPTTPVLAAGPLNQTPPTVSGTAQRGLTLTGTPGTWSGIGNSTGYQWQSSADGTHLDQHRRRDQRHLRARGRRRRPLRAPAGHRHQPRRHRHRRQHRDRAGSSAPRP